VRGCPYSRQWYSTYRLRLGTITLLAAMHFAHTGVRLASGSRAIRLPAPAAILERGAGVAMNAHPIVTGIAVAMPLRPAPCHRHRKSLLVLRPNGLAFSCRERA
jgi:hypothetical protein